MLKTLAVVLLSIPILLTGLLLSSSCVVVDVKQADGSRIVVPVPLTLARAALALAPEEAAHIEVPELAEYSRLAVEILDELREAPDGVLVEVMDDDTHVLVEKVDEEIEIDVDGRDETVSVTVPIELALEILESCDGDGLETSRVLSALTSVSRRNLVHVRTEDEEVKVWVW